jgi:hypothetical protein
LLEVPFGGRNAAGANPSAENAVTSRALGVLPRQHDPFSMKSTTDLLSEATTFPYPVLLVSR